jgi:thiaminase
MTQQDYYYLVETIQHNAFVTSSRLPQGSKLVLNISDTMHDMQVDFNFSQSFRKDITSNLHITDNDIDEGGLQSAALGYVKWLEQSTELGRYAWQVARIACTYVGEFPLCHNVLS